MCWGREMAQQAGKHRLYDLLNPQTQPTQKAGCHDRNLQLQHSHLETRDRNRRFQALGQITWGLQSKGYKTLCLNRGGAEN